MKKLFLGTSCLLLVTCSFSQSFSVQVGGNLGSAAIKDAQSGISISPKSKIGFLVGAVAEIPLSASINFRPELNFIQKGFKISISDNSGGFSYTNEAEARLNYLELPLNVVYSFPAGANHVFLGAGPSFGYGLSGKSKSKESGTGIPTVEENSDIHFGSDENNDDFKALDFGANILGGYKMTNGLFFKAGYCFGLSNISNDSETSYKNKGFSVSIGYMIHKAGEK
jgi:hypothetical protein